MARLSLRRMRAAAWESRTTEPKRLGRAVRVQFKGRSTMENTLLVGLSRQVALERQLDVIANNIANVNTTGFKAEKSTFEEFLRTPASEDNFVGGDRRVSF